MTGVIFTYPPDYRAAGLAARALRRCGVRPVLAIDRKDPLLVAEGCDVIRTSAPRQGNLNGKAWVIDALATMRAVGDGDYTLKVDSDTIVSGLAWLEGEPVAAAGIWVEEMSGMNGCCYALRTELLGSMIEAAGRMAENPYCPEDRTIGAIAARLGPVRLPVYGSAEGSFSAWSWGNGRPDFEGRRCDVIVFNNRDKRVTDAEQVRAMEEYLK